MIHFISAANAAQKMLTYTTNFITNDPDTLQAFIATCTAHIDAALDDLLAANSGPSTTISIQTLQDVFFEILDVLVDEIADLFGEDEGTWSQEEIAAVLLQTYIGVLYRGRPGTILDRCTGTSSAIEWANLWCGATAGHGKQRKTPDEIAAQLAHLSAIPQPAQRTPAWYVRRYNMLTASNMYKAFGSAAAQNALIYEKCSPLVMADDDAPVNTHDARHWGVRFEPVAAAIYQRLYQTKLAEFGCIPHGVYPFIGASPDGINCDPDNRERYGRLLEIKCPISRVIDGAPSHAYSVQMQLQMQVCDLDYCDFCEIRFVPVASAAAFYAAIDAAADKTMRSVQGAVIPHYFGCILQFKRAGRAAPEYIYRLWESAVDTRDSFSDWIDDTIIELIDAANGGGGDDVDADAADNDADNWHMTGCAEPALVFVETHYWRVDALSCLLVQRNDEWFRNNVGQMQTIWETVVRERESGYTHRAPAKRTLSVAVASDSAGAMSAPPKKAAKWARTSYDVCMFACDDEVTVTKMP